MAAAAVGRSGARGLASASAAAAAAVAVDAPVRTGLPLGRFLRGGRPPLRLNESQGQPGAPRLVARRAPRRRPPDLDAGGAPAEASAPGGGSLASSSSSARAICRAAADLASAGGASSTSSPSPRKTQQRSRSRQAHLQVPGRQEPPQAHYQRLLLEAAQATATPADAALVLSTFSSLLKPQDKGHDLHDTFSKLFERVAASPAARPRDVCLAASALARSRVWHAALGERLLRGHGSGGVDAAVPGAADFCRSCNYVDIAQLCHFVGVFRREMAALGCCHEELLGSVLQRLEALEEDTSLRPLGPEGLASLLRSVCRLVTADVMIDLRLSGRPAAITVSKLGRWLRARLLRELPLCDARHLAWALHDLHTLGLLDETTLVAINREIERLRTSRGLNARDVASIVSGYARLDVQATLARDMMRPLVPQVLGALPDASGTDLCELLHSVSSVLLRDRALMGAWATHFGALSVSLTPSQLSLVASDLAKIRYVSDSLGTFDAVLESLTAVAPLLNALDVCHVVGAMARVGSTTLCESAADAHRPLLYKLETQWLAHASEMSPQGLSSSAAAFAKLRHYSEALFDTLADASMARMKAFIPEDFAMLSSALSETHRVLTSSSWRGEPLTQLGLQAAVSLHAKRDQWSPRQVSEVLQPFAVLGMDCTQLLQAVELHVKGNSKDYTPRDLLRVMGSFQDIGHLGVPQVSKLWRITEDRLQLFNGLQAVSLAKLQAQFAQGLPEAELQRRFELLGSTILRAIPSLGAHELVEVAAIWARIRARRQWRLLGAVADAADAKFRSRGAEFDPDSTTRLVYAFAKLGAPHRAPSGLRSRLSRMLAVALGSLSAPAALSSLEARGLLRLLLAMVLRAPSTRKPTGEASALQTSSPLEVRHGTAAWRSLFLRALVGLLVSSAESARSGAAGALAAPGVAQPQSQARAQLRLIVAAARLEHSVKGEELGAPGAARIYDAMLQELAAYRESAAAGPPAAGYLSRRRGSAKSSVVLTADEKSVSAALSRVLRELARLPAGEFESEEGPSFVGAPPGGPVELAIQHVVPLVGAVRLAIPPWRVAVELASEQDCDDPGVTSPFAAASSPGDAPAAAGWGVEVVRWRALPALRLRLLRALGWRVVEVPYYEWRSLADAAQQRDFLRERLLTALQSRPQLQGPCASEAPVADGSVRQTTAHA
eukprot:TRINITY_DN25039_c0_g1_i1.p1 TRINITY_DN25039_c0_g1~~TRINITY_DN25039_c0_g1_i1.p1  ORF type:complete len:1195 (-),score=227.65 TRINITY_DN25039_c0_g1_i1:352-3894(-)